MPETFGTRLRLRREEQGIDLGTIAEELKIKLSLLEAVERDDVSNWPSGIYRRAFIRAYAHAIGLNPDVVVREFLELYPDPEHLVASAPASASEIELARTSGGPPTRLRNLVGSALGSLARLGRPPAADDSAAASWAHVMQDPVASGRAPVSAPAPVGRTTDHIAPAARERSVPRAPERPSVAAAEPVAAVAEEVPIAAPDTSSTIPEELFMDVAESTPVEVPVPVDDRETTVSVASHRQGGPPAVELDFLAVAHLCTDLGRVATSAELRPLLQEAARIIGATGIIVWLWDPTVEELAPALVHGYSDKVLAQLPTVGRDADNATAAAFRSGRTCAINGSAHSSGALVVPLVESYGCAGVLAIELQDGREQTTFVEAAATIVTAAITQLIGRAHPAEVTNEAEIIDEKHDETFTRPLRVRR
ncbi:MAG: helix-turn-helix domain-containing protein [Acidobacteriota bacterium]|nr:helix-turn-helix domain-containing protein [Acidobacteriota bacterium]